MLITVPVLKKIPQLKATDILARYQQKPDFRKTINPDLSPVQLINQLYDGKQWQELVVFLCHSLFVREVIWWGYCCIKTVQDTLPAEQQQSLKVVYQWLTDNTEPHRRLAEIEVKKIGLDNACGWLAQAVFWSGGSITPLNAPESPAPAYLYSHAVAGAISLAALLPDGKQGEKRYKQFIKQGINIAAGGSGRS
ncbi:DUF6931 family protein [Endozoicomonas euniceicola]|uniref:Secreted protein n=1 Tax=Endozoicomonas euniceicola TaxID=1234143 RepID=A0ABY6GQ30_9GAMM|nr:hypothetical protein [Endozoicomonas euniceicola]UYM14857.1 hypothetical protein NX720_18475 [Endozoicomonas euniceicola]